MKPIWLIDAGPLIALIRKDDRDHRICVSALASLPSPVATTWPVVREAVHVVETPRGKDAVLEMLERRRCSCYRSTQPISLASAH